MAWYSQSSDDFDTWANWNDAADGSGSAATQLTDFDTNDVIIQSGHTIVFNVDMHAFTGLTKLEIKGGATPGMLVCESGGDGTYYLKLTGDIIGTTDTNRGRLLANSDEVWGNTGALPNGRKFIIHLQGTAQVEATNLDIALYCTQPTNKFVHCYGTKFDFDAATDCNPTTNVLTLNTTAPAEGVDVTLVAAAGATLPTGLYEDRLYYVRDNSGNDCKLATTNSDDTIVDITADGSGTIYLLTEQASGTAELNVLEDVTSDTGWDATDGHDFVVLVDALAPASYDIQRTTISVIDDADTITLADSVDSAQYAGTRLYLSSRNVSVRYYGTTNQGIFNYGSGDTHGGVFQCEIRNAQSQTSFYGYGVYYGSGHTISGSVSGCTSGIIYGSGHTISGSVSGCNSGIIYGSGYTISGPVSGCTYGVNAGSGHTISGTVSGCNSGIIYGSGHTISGTVSGCSSGINYGSGHTISGSVSGCNYGFRYGSGHTISGSVSGCTYGFNEGSGYTISGPVSGCITSFYFPVGNIVVLPGSDVTYSFSQRDTIGYHSRIAVEEYGGTPNTYKIHDNAGDIIKTACNGTGDAPSVDPDSGNGYCIEASNIQSNCGSMNKLVIFSKHRIWLTAATYTVTYKVQTTYSGITAGNLKLTCNYIGTAGAIIETTNAPTINVRSNDADWSQTLAVTFTTTADGWADFKMELMEYQSGDAVYVWPTPVIS